MRRRKDVTPSSRSASPTSLASPGSPRSGFSQVRVSGIRLHRVRVPFRLPYTTAAGSATHREAVICEVATSGGPVGIGEASLLPHTVGSTDVFWKAVRALAASTLDRDVDDLFSSSGVCGAGPAS